MKNFFYKPLYFISAAVIFSILMAYYIPSNNMPFSSTMIIAAFLPTVLIFSLFLSFFISLYLRISNKISKQNPSNQQASNYVNQNTTPISSVPNPPSNNLPNYPQPTPITNTTQVPTSVNNTVVFNRHMFFYVSSIIFRIIAIIIVIFGFISGGIAGGMGGGIKAFIFYFLSILPIAISILLFSNGLLKQKKFIVSFVYLQLIMSIILFIYTAFEYKEEFNFMKEFPSFLVGLSINLLFIFMFNKYKSDFSGKYFSIETVIICIFTIIQVAIIYFMYINPELLTRFFKFV